jgi:hypothetical protein
MADITGLDGTVMHIDANSITLVAGPYPGDPPNRSYVSGPGPEAIASNETAAALVARLHPKQALATLTRPNNTPVWIQGTAVTLIRPPIAGDTPPGETVGAVLYVGTSRQAVKQNVATARETINSHGGNI